MAIASGIQNMPLSVVTFNIGSRKSEKEMAEKKKKMIDKFLSQHLPSLLYIQENPWREDYIKDRVPMIGKKYKDVSHKHPDAAVFYRNDVLEDEGSEESMKQLMRIFRVAFNDKDHLDFVTFRDRASFSKLTEIETRTSFIAISWHGEYIGLKDPQKKDKFKDLLLVVKELYLETNLPVILGGDFNIAFDIVSDIIEEQGLEVYDYEPVNRKTVIDFFVVTPDVKLSEVSALGDALASENQSEDSKEELDDNQARSLSYTKYRNGRKGDSDTIGDVEELKEVFDHDPVQAVVKFDIAKDNLYNVTSKNKEMDSLAHSLKSVKLNN